MNFTFKDTYTQKNFPGWVVRNQNYISGLTAWYADHEIMPGSLIKVQKSNQPGEILIHYDKSRQNKEWLKTVLIGSDKGIVFAMLKHNINAELAVCDRQRLTPNRKPHGGRPAGGCLRIGHGRKPPAAGAGVDARPVLGVRGAGGLVNFFSTTDAGVGSSRSQQPVDGSAVEVQPRGLINRPLVPVQAQPGEIVDRLPVRPALDPRAVDVLHPQDNPPPALAGQDPVDQKRPRIAQVQSPRGRWGEAGYCRRTAHESARIITN